MSQSPFIKLTVFSTILSSIYFYNPTPYTKIFSIVGLIFFSLNEQGCTCSIIQSNRISIRTALIFSAFGDILLEINQDEKSFFIFGLISFLIAHLFYIKAFYAPYENLPLSIKGLILGFYFLMMQNLLPYADNELTFPIIIYGAVISYMVSCTISRLYDGSYSSDSKYFALIGAILFAVSDSILALDKFKSPIPDAKKWIMITYYSAQTLFLISSDYEILNR